ncbi:hypothetical protein AB0C74_40060, partial [Spirillospora sp. NPDC048832]
MLFYRAALDLSRPTLTFVTGLVRDHRDRIGSRWRVLSPEVPRIFRTGPQLELGEPEGKAVGETEAAFHP